MIIHFLTVRFVLLFSFVSFVLFFRFFFPSTISPNLCIFNLSQTEGSLSHRRKLERERKKREAEEEKERRKTESYLPQAAVPLVARRADDVTGKVGLLSLSNSS